jgi:hypothetical protein
MTTPDEQTVNVAREGAQVGVQARYARIDIDTVTLPGDVQLTLGQDASPEVKYRVGVENLKSGNPSLARKLIWDVMMSDYVSNKVLFHWLVAMLSHRTVQQFSEEEIDQLRRSRSRYTEARDATWADGIRLIYGLLDSVLPPAANEAARKMGQTDMSLLVEQFDKLREDQRDMLRPHLEQFLTGPLKDEKWQQELQLAQSRQHAGRRLGRAWMFFQPIPAQVSLPPTRPEWVRAVYPLAKRLSAWLFAAVAGYLGWQLLWHDAFLGLLSFAAALAGGAVAARADLEWRFLTEQRRQKDELFQVPDRSAPSPPGDDLTDGVDKLFNRYFTRYALDRAERERWAAAAAGIRKFYRDEIIEVCRQDGFLANEVAWLIRYEVRRLKQRWENQTLYEYRRQLLPRPGTAAARRVGLAVLVLGGVWSVVALRADLLADAADAFALLSGFVAWRCWLHVHLERRRYTADSQEHACRQAEIDKELRRWSKILEDRPEDAEMAAWLVCDQTVLLGRALDHFHLPRSRLIAHAFLEEPAVAAKRSHVRGLPWRYAKYRLLAFLLAEEGVRQVRVNLDFLTGTLTIRERTSYRHDAIVSVRVLKEARRQTFELRLTAGEPITVRLRDADPSETEQDQNAGPTGETLEAAEAEDDSAPDMTSVADFLHTLERAAGECRNWFRGRGWAGVWPGDHETDSREVREAEVDA